MTSLLDSLLILKENIFKYEIILFKDSLQSKSDIVLSKLKKEENVFELKIYSLESNFERATSGSISGTGGSSYGNIHRPKAVGLGGTVGSTTASFSGRDSSQSAPFSNCNNNSNTYMDRARKESSKSLSVSAILDNFIVKLLNIKEIQRENKIKVLIIYDLWNELEFNPCLIDILLDALQDQMAIDANPIVIPKNSSNADQQEQKYNDHSFDMSTKPSFTKLINILKSFCQHLVLVYHLDLAVPHISSTGQKSSLTDSINRVANHPLDDTNSERFIQQKKTGPFALYYDNLFFIKQLEYLSTLHVTLSTLPSGHSNDADGLITFLYRGFSSQPSSHAQATVKESFDKNESESRGHLPWKKIQQKQITSYLYKTSLKGDKLSFTLI